MWSVLIATRDRPNELANLLRSLLQSNTDNDWEALVIDQSAAEIGPSFQSLLNDAHVRYLRQTGKGKSRALNLALGLARGDILAFTDDDCVVASDWLETGCKAVEASPQAGLIFGQMVAAAHDETQEFIPEFRFSRPREYRGGAWRSRGLLGMGGCMFARTSVLRDVGGFDEDLGAGGILKSGEECELTFRLLRRGFRIVQDPQAMVIHAGARKILGGEASRLVNDGFYGVGAGYGKKAALGNVAALPAEAHEVLRITSHAGRAIYKRRRPFHLRRLMMNLLGFRDGWRLGWNARRSMGSGRRSR